MNIVYFLNRLRDLGPTQAINRLGFYVQRRFFRLKWQIESSFIQTNRSWQDVSDPCDDFDGFFEKLRLNNLIDNLEENHMFSKTFPEKFKQKNWICEEAFKSLNNSFEIFGSKNFNFSGEISWKQDFINNLGVEFDDKFYQDLKPHPPQQDKNDKKFFPDVKVAWELSRFQHLQPLALAFKMSSNLDEKKTFAKVFQDHILCWIAQNSFLKGVNWMCPMEVAIRSINWIWAFDKFKYSCCISDEFWKKFIASLHDHLIYLENNPETSDRPNNHYLCDLLGEIYLTTLFLFASTSPKMNKTRQNAVK